MPESKVEVSLFVTTFIIIFHWFYHFLIVFFNIYVNNYVVIDEPIPLRGHNIYTLYNYFWRLEQITPFTK